MVKFDGDRAARAFSRRLNREGTPLLSRGCAVRIERALCLDEGREHQFKKLIKAGQYIGDTW
jgi:hypothetical protein